MTDPKLARQQLTDDPMYKYRGCAPDEDDPRRSAGDPDVSVDAWAPYTGDGQEPQRVRLARERAAVRICGWCPVRALCAAYANTETEDGHLAEPEGIFGGEHPLARHRALIARRAAAVTAAQNGTLPAAVDTPRLAVADARTPQKLAVLRSLARETDPELVAYRAGMDVRTANWHRSALVTMLGLDRETATRAQLLAAAVQHRILPPSTRIRPDGTWPYAAAPTTDGIRQRRIAPTRPVQLILPGYEHLPRGRRTPARSPERAPHPLRRALRLVPATHHTHLPLNLPTPAALEPAA
ncbi:hypothetical protein HY68_36780 [Streptomyces sp. AcH 505]|uniref:WhiB family transcriptional regulator n=1 Tax=Streptomyces sp. AcH 505 TaxID=352211 RepID=UPI000591A5E0|nr:hypothetical protein HY68_36780 [Streptomyces sp. AcH 505]